MFVLALKINASIKQRLLEFGPKNEELTTFSHQGYHLPGGEWDRLLSKCIKQIFAGLVPFPSLTLNLVTQMSSLALWPPEHVARNLVFSIQRQHNLSFSESKFPLYGFMREVATNEKKHSKLYLWQGEADAIAFSEVLEKYVIVEFKVVDNLSPLLAKQNRFMREAFGSVLGLCKAFTAAHEASLLASQPHSSHP